MASRVLQAFERFDQAELRVCRYLNRSSGYASIRQFFRLASWLGNGWLWYAVIAALPLLHGIQGWIAAAQMIATGAVGVLVYKAIKTRAVRERPYITHSMISCATAPLDRYSFPSGHTLHAVSFTVVIASYVPDWAAPSAVFAVLVALSRVILGLHYPTDVAAGAVLGGAIATLGLLFVAI